MLHIYGTFFSLPPVYGYALEYSLGENEVCWHQLLSAAVDTTCTVLRLYPGCVDTATCRPGGTPPGSAGGVKVRIAGTNCYLPSGFNLYLHGFLLFLRARICRPLHSSLSAGKFGQTLGFMRYGVRSVLLCTLL